MPPCSSPRRGDHDLPPVPDELPRAPTAIAASTIGRCASPSKDNVLSPVPSADAVVSPTPAILSKDIVLSPQVPDRAAVWQSASSDTGPGQAAVRRKFGSSESLSMESLTCAPIRAIPAYVALKFLGSVFRGIGDGYRYAREVERIDCFWSYSRHASNFMNVCTLLVHYSAWQAFLAGVAVSVVTALMMPAQLVDDGYRAGVPCMVTGLCTTLVVLVVWPSRQRVFLDRACIPQDDEEAKRTGILSLAYYLKVSKTVMVLWDVTYFQRLWCVFEFAAYLRLQVDKEEASGNAIRVLPSMYGGILAMLFVGLTVFNFVTRWFLIGVDDLPSMFSALPHHEILLRVVPFSITFCIIASFLSPFLSRHVCTFAEQEEQLVTFSLEHAECFCCSNGHRHPETHDAIPCDRELIRATVINWFGDVDIFDIFVREKLLSHTVRHARIPYRYLVACIGPPILWDMVGRVVWHFRAGQGALAWRLMLQQMSLVFLFNPLFFNVVMRSFSMWCKPGVARARMAVLSVLTTTFAHFLMWLSWRAVIHALGIYGYIIITITYSSVILLIRCVDT